MTEKQKAGIEYSLLHSWDGWDEHDVCDLYFYDVKLREDIFPKDIIDQVSDKEVDLALKLSESKAEVWVAEINLEAPIYTKNIKLSFQEV